MIFDISIPLSNSTPVYPGDPSVEIEQVARISDGDFANVSMLRLGTHSGTHVDAPYHFVQDGITLDCVPLDTMVGECLVCAVNDVPVIRVSDLEAADIPSGVERLLLKTRNSELWDKPGFQPDFTHLDPDAASWLVERGVTLVGIDYLSIDDPASECQSTHLRLLQSGVIVVEGLDLRGISEGKYTLVCLPLKILGGDGGPARVILISDES